ncbi:MAG: transglutaminase-like putative cysteine protease [Bradymonadia bacterium]|jgi:transglutaminase-like putative cysteine protease
MLKKLLSLVFTLLAWAATVSVPLLAVWVASSLAAYHFGMARAAVGVGLLFFPVFPILWDFRAERRRRKRGDERERILRRSDRVLMRTFAVNAVLVASMFYFVPAQVFTATSARGDWFLDDANGPVAEQCREVVLKGALGLEWLYEWTVENPYGEMADGEVGTGEDVDPDAQAPVLTEPDEPDLEPLPDSEPLPEGVEDEAKPDFGGGGNTDEALRSDGRVLPGDRMWPLSATVHPAVTAMPVTAKRSLDSVAAYLAANTQGEADLAKAVHDFVALHVEYDAAALEMDWRSRAPQDAATVFRSGRGVCAGYANLYAVVATRAGLNALYIVGDSRSATTGEVADVGHAWNVVKVNGAWYHIDATWNSGGVSDGHFEERYSTDYLFTPAHIFGETHYPDNPQWQLMSNPIDRTAFARRLIVRPGFHAAGLQILQPTTWPTETGSSARVVIDNPGAESIWLQISRPNSDEKTECARPSDSSRIDVSCDVPSRGQWIVHVLVEGEGERMFWTEAGLRFVR